MKNKESSGNLSTNSDLLSRVYHTINRKTIPDAKKAGYHRHDDTLPLFFTNGSDLHCSCPVPPNRGGANGAPAGGAFLVDIPSRWKPRTKQQPTGLLFVTPAAWPCCSRPVPPTQKIPSHLTRDFCGGRYRTRTCDLLHVKQMLYQLS